MPRPTDPALVDSRTGLSNERHFRILYEFAFAAGDRGIPLTLALLTVNGGEGSSDAGEDVDPRVQRMGALLSGASREMDVVAHMDDGRFLALLLDCNLQGGLIFADRMRGLVDSLREEWDVTLSLGLAAYQEGMNDPDELLELVGRCLETARADGGDRVVTPRDL